MEEIVRLTLQAIQKVQIDLGTYMVELKTVNSQTRKGFADNVAKVFEEQIVKNMVDLNMAQLYSLGMTAPGKQCGLIPRLFDPEEIMVLESMSNEEQLHDLEESIIINASHIGPDNRRMKSNFSFPKGSSGSGEGSLDFGDIKKQMNPDLMNEMLELKQQNQIQSQQISQQNDYIKKLSNKVRKYQKSAGEKKE